MSDSLSDTLIEPSEFERGYLPAEFLAEREQFYAHVSGRKTFLGCGDERPITEASGEQLSTRHPEAVSPVEAFTSAYGGIAGVAKNILVTGTAQSGSVFIEEHGDFKTVLKKTVKRFSADSDVDALIPALHSAADKEHDDASFDPDSIDALACAYVLKIGAGSKLLLDQDGPTQSVARHDQIQVHGNDKDFERLLDGHFEFLQQATGGAGADFALSRADYVSAQTDIMILAGIPHEPAESTGLINNYELDSVRSSNQAMYDEKAFYNQDIARVTAAVLRTFPEMHLEPELLMRAFLLDSTPVRAVLGIRADGTLDPRNLRMGIRGNVQQALETISTNV